MISPRLFKALADPCRISILAQVAECCGPMTVGEVAACCPVDLSVVSRHLAILREAGVVEAVKKGREVHYSVRIPALVDSLRRLADALETCCPPTEKIQTEKETRS